MYRTLVLAGAAVVMLAASIVGANAQPLQRVQVGILECRGGASVGFIVGSVTNLGCVLRADGMPEDRYVATIRKVGLDLGITQESALAWGVFAPVARLGPGDLSGDYVGAQGSATLGVGVGGNCAGRRLRQFDRAAAAQACRARSASPLPPGWKASNSVRGADLTFQKPSILGVT
mgnify:CR=1 FL=1